MEKGRKKRRELEKGPRGGVGEKDDQTTRMRRRVNWGGKKGGGVAGEGGEKGCGRRRVEYRGLRGGRKAAVTTERKG